MILTILAKEVSYPQHQAPDAAVSYKLHYNEHCFEHHIGQDPARHQDDIQNEMGTEQWQGLSSSKEEVGWLVGAHKKVIMLGQQLPNPPTHCSAHLKLHDSAPDVASLTDQHSSHDPGDHVNSGVWIYSTKQLI